MEALVVEEARKAELRITELRKAVELREAEKRRLAEAQKVAAFPPYNSVEGQLKRAAIDKLLDEQRAEHQVLKKARKIEKLRLAAEARKVEEARRAHYEEQQALESQAILVQKRVAVMAERTRMALEMEAKRTGTAFDEAEFEVIKNKIADAERARLQDEYLRRKESEKSSSGSSSYRPLGGAFDPEYMAKRIAEAERAEERAFQRRREEQAQRSNVMEVRESKENHGLPPFHPGPAKGSRKGRARFLPEPQPQQQPPSMDRLVSEVVQTTSGAIVKKITYKPEPQRRYLPMTAANPSPSDDSDNEH